MTDEKNFGKPLKDEILKDEELEQVAGGTGGAEDTWDDEGGDEEGSWDDEGGEDDIPDIKEGMKKAKSPKIKPAKPITPAKPPITPAKPIPFKPRPFKSKLKGCFEAGSLVSTPEGAKPIETIRVGDEVISPDAAGNKRIGKVVELLPECYERIIEVIFSDGTKWFATETQWFYCGGDDYACIMNSGDKRALLEVGGSASVEKITVTERVERVYDFVVEGLNVMFINGVASEGYSDD